MAIDIIPGGVATGESFFGRDQEINALWSELNRSRNLLMVSPRRVGKTSLLHHLEDNPRGGWAVVYVDLQRVVDPVAAIELILDKLKKQGAVGQNIWSAFVSKLESIENIKIGLDGASLSLRQAASRRWDATSSAFVDALLASGAKGNRLVLIVDEFPILIKALVEDDKIRLAEDLLRLFRFARLDNGLLANFRMIVCGSIGLKPVLRRHKMSADANDLKGFPLGPWSEKTARAFMDAIASAKPNLNFSSEIREAILRCTGTSPLPYHLQAVLSQLEDLGKDAAEVTVTDVGEARDLALREAEFDHYFERLEAVFEPVELELALLVLAHLSITECSALGTIQALLPGSDKFKPVLRTLLEDGYIISSQSDSGEKAYLFSNPMLKAYWALTHG